MSSAMNTERKPSLCHSGFLSFASRVGQSSLLLHTPRVVALSHGVRAAVHSWWKPNHERVGLLLASFRTLGSGLRAIANIRFVPSHTRHTFPYPETTSPEIRHGYVHSSRIPFMG